jgi:hypothetical protein
LLKSSYFSNPSISKTSFVNLLNLIGILVQIILRLIGESLPFRLAGKLSVPPKEIPVSAAAGRKKLNRAPNPAPRKKRKKKGGRRLNSPPGPEKSPKNQGRAGQLFRTSSRLLTGQNIIQLEIRQLSAASP